MNKTEIKIDWEKELIEIEDYTDHERAFLLWLIESETVDLAAYLIPDLERTQEQIINDLAKDMYVDENEYSPKEYSHEQIEGEYQIFTNDEADAACKESLESLVDECVLPEIPENYRHYFDTDRFVKDCMNDDGRGHSLNKYDGEEHEVKFNGEYYYIYRTN